MKVTSDIPGFENRIHGTVDRVARPLYRDQVRGAVRTRSGRYRASVVVNFQRDTPHHSVVTVSSPLFYGRPLEYGANVGARRGPHMTGDHAVENVTRSRWGSVLSRALRGN
jgi:hypothetical protein